MIQRIADSLHLRHNQPAFRRLEVYRNYHYHRRMSRRQIAQQNRRIDEVFGDYLYQSGFQLVQHPVAAAAVGRNDFDAVFGTAIQIAFVINFNQRQFACFDLADNFLLLSADFAAFADQNRHVSTVQNPTGFGQTFRSQNGFIAETGRIQPDDGTKRQKLLCFFDNVGGRTGNIGSNGYLLTGNQV